MAAVRIAGTAHELTAMAGALVLELASDAVRRSGNVVMSLAGGSTPRAMYEWLAQATTDSSGLDWRGVHLFWSDERLVPPDDPNSNYRMAHEALIGRVPVPASQVHRMPGELPPKEAARAYEIALPGGFTGAGRSGCTFDILLLGLGEDAHIASLFPGSPLLEDTPATNVASRVASVWVPHLGVSRLTLRPSALLDAAVILVLVSGAAKARAVQSALEDEPDVRRVPAHLLRQASGRVEWLMDADAAARLSPRLIHGPAGSLGDHRGGNHGGGQTNTH